MIGNAKELITRARASHQAVPALNIDSIDMAMAVIQAGERCSTGFILQVTVETLDIWGWEFLTETLMGMAEKSSVPVALQLDHAKRIDAIQRAVDLGYQGVMFDGSTLPLSDNIAQTQTVVRYARASGTFVEGEVGHVARDGEPPEWEHLTTVAEAKEYWDATGIDALAVAVGSKHGHYRSAQDINVERVGEICAAAQAPLVLHGGSGLPAELFGAVIRSGIAKVNVGTELRRVWWAAMDAARQSKPREALLSAREHVANRAIEIINLMRNSGLSPQS